MNEIGIKNLCAGVVKRAAMDYLISIRYFNNLSRRQKSGRMYEYYSYMKNDCERFFKNEEVFSLYCDMDGEWVMNKIQEQSCNPNYKIYEFLPYAGDENLC